MFSLFTLCSFLTSHNLYFINNNNGFRLSSVISTLTLFSTKFIKELTFYKCLKKVFNLCFLFSRHKRDSKHLSPPVEALKRKANSYFEKNQCTKAIILYNQAISMMPHASVLYGNRAAAYMKRKWYVSEITSGGIYSAVVATQEM